METIKRSVVVRGYGGWKLEHRGFYGSETSLCDTLMVDPVTIQVSKPIRYTTAAVSPNVNYGLGVIMTCQSRFIHCNKCTIWWGMLIKVKLRIHRGQRFMASLSTFLSAVLQTKTALKNKVYLKIWGLPRWSSGSDVIFQCRGCGFKPWSGGWDPTWLAVKKP